MPFLPPGSMPTGTTALAVARTGPSGSGILTAGFTSRLTSLTAEKFVTSTAPRNHLVPPGGLLFIYFDLFFNPFLGRDSVASVLIFRDNSKLISCGGDRQIFYWDVASGRVIRRFRGHDSEVSAFSQN